MAISGGVWTILHVGDQWSWAHHPRPALRQSIWAIVVVFLLPFIYCYARLPIMHVIYQNSFSLLLSMYFVLRELVSFGFELFLAFVGSRNIFQEHKAI